MRAKRKENLRILF